jgi:hypothetical protein
MAATAPTVNQLALPRVAWYPASLTRFLSTFQRTMSMTKATPPARRPRKLRMAIIMVAPREAAATPMSPDTKAKNERPPAMGCRISVLDRLWSMPEFIWTLSRQLKESPQLT